MATCGSLMSLFEKPLPERPSLIDSLSSWNQTIPKKLMEDSSITEIFGELHFQEKKAPESPHSELNKANGENSAAPKNLFGCDLKCNGSLQLCTEGLGSESSDDVDDLMSDVSDDWRSDVLKERGNGTDGYSISRPRGGARRFPPPISSIGRSGKPSVCFKSYREGGRFVLREIKIPTQEFLRASRENGRLKLRFVHQDVHIEQVEEDEEEEEDDEEEEGDEEAQKHQVE